MKRFVKKVEEMKRPKIITSGLVKNYADEIRDAINRGDSVSYIGINTGHLFGNVVFAHTSQFEGGEDLFRVGTRNIQDLELTNGRKLIIGQLYA